MKVFRFGTVLAAWGLAIAGTSAMAQSVPQGCEAGAASTSRRGALTVYPDVPLYMGQVGEEKVPGPHLKFRTRLLLLPGAEKGGRVLVRAETDRNECGYVQRSKIHSGNPLTVVDIFPGEVERRSGIEVRNTWLVKAMLRSNPSLDKDAQLAQFYEEPDGKTPFRSSRVFGLFNVYKVEKKPGDRGPDDWWFFIGGDKLVNNTALSGWVRGGNLFLWRSSVAVFNSPDKAAPFDVYADIGSLRALSKEGLLARRGGGGLPDKRDTAKFPVLDQVFKMPEDRKLAKPYAYEIGFFGQACTAAGACRGEAEIADDLAKIGEVLRKSGQIDVMLVIDNTTSMTEYFAPIASAVSRWAKQAAEKQKASDRKGWIRFAAAIYGDYKDPARRTIDNMDFRLIAQFDPNADKLAAALTRVGPAYGDALRDQPEAGYAALIRAAKEGRWSSDAGYKLIVWIGDQGVRHGPDEPALLPQVQKELGQEGIYLTAINVVGSKPDVSTFVEDANSVLDWGAPRKTRKVLGVPGLRTFLEGKDLLKDPEIAAQRVTEVLDVVLFFSKTVPAWIQSQRGVAAQSGKKGEEVSLVPRGIPWIDLVDTKDLVEGPLRRVGLDPDAVTQVLKANQLMTKGLVAYEADKRNIAFFAAMQPKIFTPFASFIKGVCDAMTTDDSLGEHTVAGLMAHLGFTFGGDPYRPPETIAEYLDRTTFIPKRHFATWLNLSTNDFANEWHSADEKRRQEIQFSACRSAHLLDLMGSKQKVASLDDLKFQDPQRGVVGLKDGRSLQPFTWLWSTDSEIEYYFVPVDYLPN